MSVPENTPWTLFTDTQQRLSICTDNKQKTDCFCVDFVSGKNAWRSQHGGGYQQQLARACGLKANTSLTVLDATAGFGRDAFVLASLGAELILIEEQPVIHALLADGIQRLIQHNAALGSRLCLHHGNAIDYMQAARDTDIDIVYLDPMYPQRSKSAAVQKSTRWLQRLADTDVSPASHSALLTAAIQYAKKRVVVKRPKTAPWLNHLQPDFCYRSKSTRYDVYLPQQAHKKNLLQT